ncbi:MAG: DUF2922 family protein [Selenomonadaceae bacterium]|nr:DUF2922 family protein [Selenomonadaceae bacterium]
MADVTTTKSTLQNVFKFADDDTRIINIDEPQDSITAAQIQVMADYATEHQILIGDKAGASLTGIASSERIDLTSTKLDLS